LGRLQLAEQSIIRAYREPFEALASDGFAVFRGVIGDDAIRSVRAFLSAKSAEAISTIRKYGLPEDLLECGRSIQKLLDDSGQRLQRDDAMLLTGHFPLDVRLSQSLWAIPRDPELLALLREILGASRLFMHMPPAARFVLPGNSAAGVPPHQDISYNAHMADFVTIWVPLVEVDAECGGVTIFKGSHRSEIADTTLSGPVWLREISTSGYERIDCVPMAPGDILVFRPRVIHGSMANDSSRMRLSVDFRFFGENVASTKHYLDLQSWQVTDPIPNNATDPQQTAGKSNV
jgi:hypothetical protein